MFLFYLEISRWAKYIWKGKNSTRKTNYKTIYSQKSKRWGNSYLHIFYYDCFLNVCVRLYLIVLLKLVSSLRFSSSCPPRRTRLSCVPCRRNRSNSTWVFSANWKSLSITWVWSDFHNFRWKTILYWGSILFTHIIVGSTHFFKLVLIWRNNFSSLFALKYISTNSCQLVFVFCIF